MGRDPITPKDRAVKVLNWLLVNMPKGEWYLLPTAPVMIDHPRSILKLLPGLPMKTFLIILLASSIIRFKGNNIVYNEKGKSLLQQYESKHCIFETKQFAFGSTTNTRNRSYWVILPGARPKPDLDDVCYRNRAPKPRTLEVPENKQIQIDAIMEGYELSDKQKNALDMSVASPSLTINTSANESTSQLPVITPESALVTDTITFNLPLTIDTSANESTSQLPVITPESGTATISYNFPLTIDTSANESTSPLPVISPHSGTELDNKANLTPIEEPPSQGPDNQAGIVSEDAVLDPKANLTTIEKPSQQLDNQAGIVSKDAVDGTLDDGEEGNVICRHGGLTSFDSVLSIADDLDFDARPRPARDGSSDIELVSSKAFSSEMRKDTAYLFLIVLKNDSSLSNSKKKKLREALLRIVAYDYGHHSISGTHMVMKWINTLVDTLESSGAPLSCTLADETQGRPTGNKLWQKIENGYPSCVRQLCRAAVKNLTSTASFAELAEEINCLSRKIEHAQGRPSIDLNQYHLRTWFKAEGGKEKSIVERPIITQERKIKRVRWSEQRKRDLQAGQTFVFLDEKWFYMRSRRKKAKALPWVEGEDISYARPAPRRISSRRHASKIMYMGVVAAPVHEHDFDGKIALIRVSETKSYQK